jgi:hypothetical protein
MTGNVTSISRPKIEQFRMTCRCTEPYGWATFHVLIGSDASLAYECTNCGAEHDLTPEEIAGAQGDDW